MAQTAAQKALAAAKAQIKKTQARLQQDEQAILNASNQSTSVNTTTLAGITAASQGTTGYVPPVDTYGTAKVGSTNKTQAQLDAAANAAAVAKSTGGTVDPKTGYVIPKKKVVVNPDVPPDDPTDTDVYEFKGSMLYFGGKPFTGEYGGVTYKGGIKQSTRAELDAEQAAVIAAEEKANEKRDAFALIQSTMSAYGFLPEEWDELNSYIQSALLNPKIGPNQALLEMRNLSVYKKRFAGNTARVNAGLNALSEFDYLKQEDAYSQTFRAYGLQNMNSRSQFATLMGNDISNVELGKRVGLAIDRVKNADPKVMSTLNQYYGSINDKDLISYFLNPKEALPELQKKVTTGEIGAAAAQYGLVNKDGLSNVSRSRAEEFASLGVTQDTARVAYETISEKLPRGQQLSDISKEDNINYDQTLAEDVTIKGLASAKRAESKLIDKEKGRFTGAFGTNQYSLKNSASGSF